jgi:hypothetical protein
MKIIFRQIIFYFKTRKLSNVFIFLLDNASESLKKDIIKQETVEQNIIWHPELTCLNHIIAVTNRLHNKFHNINLTLAGLFHDLGKFDTTKWDEERQSWTAYGHESFSIDYIEKHKDWIKQMGGNIKKIKYIVANHMRIKFIDEMRRKKRRKFEAEKWFHLVVKFKKCDKGGF